MPSFDHWIKAACAARASYVFGYDNVHLALEAYNDSLQWSPVDFERTLRGAVRQTLESRMLLLPEWGDESHYTWHHALELAQRLAEFMGIDQAEFMIKVASISKDRTALEYMAIAEDIAEIETYYAGLEE